MKVLICGSRNISDLNLIGEAIEASGFRVTEIISGGANGVDDLAERYASISRIPTNIFYPKWNLYGKKAGIIRNYEMVKAADAVIAVWDGESKGTKSTINFTRREKKPLYVLRLSGSDHPED